MIKSKLTSEAQTTISRSVRDALHVAEGDELVYAIDGERVILTKSVAEPADDPFATFEERASDNDCRVYADL